MCGGAEASVSSPEERIASIISEEAGVYINPQVVRMMIKYRWRDLSTAAHPIHGTGKNTCASQSSRHLTSNAKSMRGTKVRALTRRHCHSVIQSSTAAQTFTVNLGSSTGACCVSIPGQQSALTRLQTCSLTKKPLDKAALGQALDSLQKNALVKNPAILDTLAWSNYRLGDLQKAKELLVLANADHSSNPQLRFHYGAVLIALGEHIKGQQLIEKTLNDTFPGRNEAEDILKN